jgi:hypothetical protein
MIRQGCLVLALIVGGTLFATTYEHNTGRLLRSAVVAMRDVAQPW